MMTFRETFQLATVFLKIYLILAPLGCLFQIIGVATEYWFFEEYIVPDGSEFGYNNSGPQNIQFHGGLWSEGQYFPGWMAVVRVFSIIGILSGAATTMIIVACLFVSAVSQSKISHIITLVGDVITVGSILIGVIQYGANYIPDYYEELIADPRLVVITARSPHWSFGICVTAAILFFIASILLLLNLFKKRQS